MLKYWALKKRTIILFYLTGLLICLDQFSKLWVRSNFALGEKRHLWDWLSIVHHRNNGFAFNTLKEISPALQNIFILAIPAFSLVLIVLIIIKIQDNQTLPSFALTAILGGAIGNMIDRFEQGPVLDIFQINLNNKMWAPFNVADISILSGVVIIFLNTLFTTRRGQRE